ncbi:MAG: biotin transporter BioY [Candidatus Latescibacteria bacterium]|nr:biotin transporter BioY [Candidatus Latescibacterota bacterium]
MQKQTKKITHIALFAALIAVSAFIRIPLGIVPLTLQSSAVLITGYYLGPSQGAAAALLYTGIGLAGIPVFAHGGGPAYVLSPTFGYIIGFTVCAWLTGLLANIIKPESILFAYVIMLTGLAGIYIPGVIWLFIAMRWIAETPPSVMTIMKTGLLLPLAGDFVTTIPAAIIAVRIKKQQNPDERRFF